MTAAPPDRAARGLSSLLGEAVFLVDAEEYRWEDVVVAAVAWGRWGRLEAQAAEDAACVRRAKAEGDPLSKDAVGSAGRAFRSSRDLFAADEMEAWLERWSLDAAAWTGHLRRCLLREHWSSDLAATASCFPAPADEARAVLEVDAICSGALMAFARLLATRAAAHSALGSPDPPDSASAFAAVAVVASEFVDVSDRARERGDRLVWLDESLRRFRDGALTPEALDRLVDAREIDWLRVEYRELALADEGMAREAGLCVRDDGMALGMVADQAGGTVEARRVYLEDTDPPLRDLLVSAGEGELVGPYPADGQFLLVAVDVKARPSLADPAIRERAEREVARRALGQEVIDRVRWRARR